MSSHTNNARQPPRPTNGASAWYGNDDRVHTDLISPPSRPFPPPVLDDRVGVDPWWWSLQDRILTLPSPLMNLPRSHMQVVVFRNNLADDTNLRPRPREQTPQRGSILTLDEQKKALGKLKKEIYNPTPKKIIQRLGRFYRQNDARKASGGQKTEKVEEEDDDKRCAVCLEDFEAKEVVMLTPCNHMFHEECILPWVKSHGKCPVCRFSLCDRTGESGVPSTNNSNMVNDPSTADLISFVTSRGRGRGRGSSPVTAPFLFG